VMLSPRKTIRLASAGKLPVAAFKKLEAHNIQPTARETR
jgi:hypothetical protein